MDDDTQAHSSEQAQLDNEATLKLFAQHANEIAHELLVQLKHAVQYSDDRLAKNLFAKLRIVFGSIFYYSIRNKYQDEAETCSLDEYTYIVERTFLCLLRQIGDYEESSFHGISWMMTICNNLVYQRMKEKKEHPLVSHFHSKPDVYKEPLEVDASPYITEVERFLREAREAREARTQDLEKSQTIDVKSSLNTTVESGEIPAPTGVDTMGGVEGQPISHPEEAPKTVAEQRAEIAQALPVEKPVLPLLGLHKELEKVGAYDKIENKKHRQALEAYLTTDISQRDLMQKAGVHKDNSINNIIHRSLNKAFADLKPDVQAQFGGSANEAIRLKAEEQIKKDLSRKRIKGGVAGKERTYTKPRGRPKGVVETQPRQYKEKTGRPKGRKDNYPRKARKGSDSHERQVSESPERSPQEQPTHQQRPPHEVHTIVDLTKAPQEY